MNCTVCGAVIPNGQQVCPMCGNMIQYQQPQQGYGSVTGHVSHGIGPIFGWIGVGLATIPRVLKMVKK